MSENETPAYAKPLPNVTTLNKPFWDAAKEHKLVLQRCEKCGWHQYPAVQFCPQCNGSLQWVPVSGRGTLHTFTLIHMVYNQAFKEDVPYNVSVIELEEGPFIVSNMVNCPNNEIKIGTPVRVVFEDVTPEESIPKWERA